MNKFSETEIIWQLRNWAIEVESPRNDGWTKYHYLSKLMKIKDYVDENLSKYETEGTRERLKDWKS
tara:strand:+ start:1517 stop:1714 length:198 start_codon:yes stop_codon:yes gene_type:complete